MPREQARILCDQQILRQKISAFLFLPRLSFSLLDLLQKTAEHGLGLLRVGQNAAAPKILSLELRTPGKGTPQRAVRRSAEQNNREIPVTLKKAEPEQIIRQHYAAQFRRAEDTELGLPEIHKYRHIRQSFKFPL